MLRYVFADDSGKIREFEASKNIKHNTPYEFIADCQSKADISQNKFLSIVADYKLFFVEYELFKHCLVTWKKV